MSSNTLHGFLVCARAHACVRACVCLLSLSIFSVAAQTLTVDQRLSKRPLSLCTNRGCFSSGSPSVCMICIILTTAHQQGKTQGVDWRRTTHRRGPGFQCSVLPKQKGRIAVLAAPFVSTNLLVLGFPPGGRQQEDEGGREGVHIQVRRSTPYISPLTMETNRPPGGRGTGAEARPHHLPFPAHLAITPIQMLHLAPLVSHLPVLNYSKNVPIENTPKINKKSQIKACNETRTLCNKQTPIVIFLSSQPIPTF